MRYIFILFLLLINNAELLSQKNALTFVYTPAITKLRIRDVKDFGDNVFMDVYKVWYNSQKPNKSAYGYNLGFTYQRKINAKITLELGFFQTVLKANSGNFFQVRGVNAYQANYGGIEYNLTYLGLEAPFIMYFQVYNDGKLALKINTGVSFNLMGEFSLEHHLIQKISGEKYKTASYLRISDPRLDAYITKFDEKRHQRIGTSLGLSLNYQLNRHLSISVSPIVKYYSNALEKSYVIDALRADAFLLGLQSQINFNF